MAFPATGEVSDGAKVKESRVAGPTVRFSDPAAPLMGSVATRVCGCASTRVIVATSTPVARPPAKVIWVPEVQESGQSVTRSGPIRCIGPAAKRDALAAGVVRIDISVLIEGGEADREGRSGDLGGRRAQSERLRGTGRHGQTGESTHTGRCVLGGEDPPCGIEQRDRGGVGALGDASGKCDRPTRGAAARRGVDRCGDVGGVGRT